jgi:hypothetical protein
MVQSLCWEAHSCSASQEITRLLWNPNFHYCVRNVHHQFPSWARPTRSIPSDLIFLRHKLILFTNLRLDLRRSVFRLYNQNVVPISHLSHVCYRPVHLIPFDFVILINSRLDHKCSLINWRILGIFFDECLNKNCILKYLIVTCTYNIYIFISIIIITFISDKAGCSFLSWSTVWIWVQRHVCNFVSSYVCALMRVIVSIRSLSKVSGDDTNSWQCLPYDAFLSEKRKFIKVDNTFVVRGSTRHPLQVSNKNGNFLCISKFCLQVHSNFGLSVQDGFKICSWGLPFDVHGGLSNGLNRI